MENRQGLGVREVGREVNGESHEVAEESKGHRVCMWQSADPYGGRLISVGILDRAHTRLFRVGISPRCDFPDPKGLRRNPAREITSLRATEPPDRLLVDGGSRNYRRAHVNQGRFGNVSVCCKRLLRGRQRELIIGMSTPMKSKGRKAEREMRMNLPGW